MKKRPIKKEKARNGEQVVYGRDELKSSTGSRSLSPKRRRQSMTSQTLEISVGNVQDQICAFLYATKQIPEDVDISSIEWSKPKNGLLPLKLKLKEDILH